VIVVQVTLVLTQIWSVVIDVSLIGILAEGKQAGYQQKCRSSKCRRIDRSQD